MNPLQGSERSISNKVTILVICQHNSGRSQIAEAYLNKFYGDHVLVESAGLEPAQAVNPLVIIVMMEEGIDLSGKKRQSVFELFKQGKLYAHVVRVCQDTENKCPIFSGIRQRWYWPFPDPVAVEGTETERLEGVRKIRDMIKDWLLNPPDNTLDIKQLIQKA
jgi:arsenate reductase